MTELERSAFEVDFERRLTAYAAIPVAHVDADAVALAAHSRGRAIAGGLLMRPTLRTLAIVAATIAIIGVIIGASLFGGGRQRLGIVPLPATLVPTMTADVGTQLPAALRARWTGSPRDVPGRGASPMTQIVFTDHDEAVTGATYSPTGLWRSRATIDASGALTLTNPTRADDCAAGNAGSYRWSVSPGGSVLTIEPGADTCAARAAAVPGRWNRIGCKDPKDDCLGDLEAGTYQSLYLTPRRHSASDPAAPDYGAVTYTVPVGWSNSGDWPNVVVLTPAPDYALEGPDGPPAGTIHELDIYPQPAAAVQDGSCANVVDASVDRSVDGLVAWLRRQRALDVSKPTSITVDGRPGKVVDVALAPSWTASCPGTSAPSVALLSQPDFLDASRGWGIPLAGRERDRVILVDLGGGDTVGIVIDSTDPSRFDELVSSAMPIVESLRFR